MRFLTVGVSCLMLSVFGLSCENPSHEHKNAHPHDHSMSNTHAEDSVPSADAAAAATNREALTPIDPETARTESIEIGEQRGFNEHPLFEKWVSLRVKLFTQQAHTPADIIAYVEVKLQILKDTAPETEAEQIKKLENSLAVLKQSNEKDRVVGPLKLFTRSHD